MAQVIFEPGDIVVTQNEIGVYLNDTTIFEIFRNADDEGKLFGRCSPKDVSYELMPNAKILNISRQNKVTIDAILLTLGLPARFGFGSNKNRTEDVEDK